MRIVGEAFLAIARSNGKKSATRRSGKEQQDMWRNTTHCSIVFQKRDKNLYAVGEDESEISEEAVDNKEELQAWCQSLLACASLGATTSCDKIRGRQHQVFVLIVCDLETGGHSSHGA